MKLFSSLALAFLLGPVLALSEERDKPRVAGPVASTGASNHLGSLTATQTVVEVRLNGISAASGLKMAILEIQTPGREIRCTLREGEMVAGVQLLAVHGGRGTVTIRHLNSTNEIALMPVAHTLASQPEEDLAQIERQKDVSHSEHHKLRARLERERDERESAGGPGPN
jgi:hypothetical protein